MRLAPFVVKRRMLTTVDSMDRHVTSLWKRVKQLRGVEYESDATLLASQVQAIEAALATIKTSVCTGVTWRSR